MEEIHKILNEIIDPRSKGLNDHEEGIVKCIIRALSMEEQNLITENTNKFLFDFFKTDILPNSLLLQIQEYIQKLIDSKKWLEINQILADKIFRYALTDNYALSGERISDEKAMTLSNQFFNFFAKDTRYFSNAAYSFKNIGEYNSLGFGLTGGLEHCMICFNKELIGCIWVLDHD